jgi:hypothetical protein
MVESKGGDHTRRRCDYSLPGETASLQAPGAWRAFSVSVRDLERSPFERSSPRSDDLRHVGGGHQGSPCRDHGRRNGDVETLVD